ncbi:MAG: hypothetical protein R3E65_09985 [Steroidobacteraceae bacterium]
MRRELALGIVTRLLLGDTPRVLGGAARLRLFLDAPPVLGLDALGFAPLGLGTLALRLGLLLDFALLGVDLVLLRLDLLLEHFALDVGPLDAHFDVDGPRASRATREFQLALRLALQRDLARGAAGGPRLLGLPVAAPQMRQQFELLPR